MREAVSKYSNQLVVHIPQDRQSAGQGTLFLFPDASGDLDSLASGDTKPAESIKQAQDLTAQAKTSLTAIQAIRVNAIISSDFDVGVGSVRGKGVTLATLRDSQFLIIQGLRGYQRVFTLWQTAAQDTVPAAARRQLVSQAQTLAADSERLFDEGWTKFVQVRHEAGLPPIQVNELPAPVPSVQPTASPSESGASPSASPSESGSSPSPSGSAPSPSASG
jgi:hypothetical protein